MLSDHDPKERRRRSTLEEWGLVFLALIAIWQAFGLLKEHPRLWWLVAFVLVLFYLIFPLFDHSLSGPTDF